MRKTLLLFTTMALALLLAAGMAWAAPGPPTVVSTVPPTPAVTTPPTPPPTGVDPTANIKAKFSEAMRERSINTSTFYLLPGHFTYEQLNCTASATTVCADLPDPVLATVRYNDDTKTAVLNPTATLAINTEYTAVVEGRGTPTGDGDMKAVKDSGGTPMASDYIFYFTTATGVPGGGGV